MRQTVIAWFDDDALPVPSQRAGMRLVARGPAQPAPDETEAVIEDLGRILGEALVAAYRQDAVRNDASRSGVGNRGPGALTKANAGDLKKPEVRAPSVSQG